MRWPTRSGSISGAHLQVDAASAVCKQRVREKRVHESVWLERGMKRTGHCNLGLNGRHELCLADQTYGESKSRNLVINLAADSSRQHRSLAFGSAHDSTRKHYDLTGIDGPEPSGSHIEKFIVSLNS